MRRVLTPLAFVAALMFSSSIIFPSVAAREPAAAARLSVSSASAAPSRLSQTVSGKKPIVVASGSQFSGVRGLAVDALGQLYISLSADPPATKCVSRIAPASRSGFAQLILVFSNCESVASEDPSGIAVTLDGRVFLANLAQNAVRMLDMRTGKVQILPPVSKSQDMAARAGSNLDPYEPSGLAVDTRQNLFIADRGNNRVLAFSPGAQTFSYLAHVLDVQAIASNARGTTIYAASPASHLVFRIDVAEGMASPFAGNGDDHAPPSHEFSSPVPPLNISIAAPSGVAIDGAGNVFISDAASSVLLRVDASSGMLTAAVATGLDSPGALAIDRKGNVFVADRGNRRIMEFPALAAPAAAGNVAISPASLDFGAQPTGGSTATQALTLANNSAAAISFTADAFSFSGANPNDFTQTNNCAPQVAAGGTCQINVAFAPQGTGARSAAIEVTDSDPSSPQTAQLTGTGDTFNLVGTTTETTANAIPGNTATYTLTLQPDSAFSGTVTVQCPAALPRGANLTCSTNPSSVDLTPGQSQQFNVKITTQGPNATSPVSIFPSTPFFPGNGSRRGIGLEAAAFLLALLALALAYSRRSRQSEMSSGSGRAIAIYRSRAPRLLAAIFALASVLSAAGCYHRPSFNPNETPVGVYRLDITATSQGASRSITLTLNVE